METATVSGAAAPQMLAGIDLWLLDELVLILELPTRVTYSTQAGGVFCLRKQAEGALVPVDAEWMTNEERGNVLDGLIEVCSGKSLPHLTTEVADMVDEVLRRSKITSGLKVDRNRLDDCAEAWIYVRFDYAGSPRTDLPWSGALSGTGVLTWPNSD